MRFFCTSLVFVSSGCTLGKPTAATAEDNELKTALAVLKTATAQAISPARIADTATAVSEQTLPILPAATETTVIQQATPTPLTIQEIGQLLIESTGINLPALTPWSTPLGPKAMIYASIPEITPCISLGGNGCVWKYSVTFRADNSIGGKINRVWTVFLSKNGKRYVRNITGLSAANTVIPAWGSGTYSDIVIDMFNTTVDLRGGKILLTYEGVDENGNLIRGEVSTRLALN